MSPDFEEVIACGDYLIEIERFIVKSGVVSVKLNILQNQIIK